MRRVMTMVGTRPELIKMSRVIAELDAHCDHVLVHTGQNYDHELSQVFFEDLGIRQPDVYLGAARDSAAKAIGAVISLADEVIVEKRPEAILFYGDTNSCLAVIAAKRRKVPVFHFEAGNRCFDERVPEELNRKVLDHLSDINFVLSEHARRYLIAEGIRPETIIKTGSHLPEVLEHAMPRIEASDIMDRLGLDVDKFFLVSAHREETVDSPTRLQELLDTLQAVADEWGLPVIVSTHPRTQQRLEVLGALPAGDSIRFMRPFPFSDYIRLQQEARCVVSDSGTITEEASILNLPAITIRDAHERPEGMDEGTLMMTGLQASNVLDAIRIVTSHHDRGRRVFPMVKDYDSGPVAKQAVRVVLSYIDYVNRTVWRRGYA